MVKQVSLTGLGLLGALSWAGNALATEVDVAAGGGSATSAGHRGMNDTISLLGNFGYAYSAGTGFGLSGRFQHTVVPEGFIEHSKITDDLGIEAAVDYYHYSWDFFGYSWSYNEFGLSASAVWNVWFTKEFAAYPRLGLGFAFGSFSGNDGIASPSGGYGGLFFVGGAGVLYELAPVTLRAEVSNSSLCLGAAISI